jgi:NTE family protein
MTLAGKKKVGFVLGGGGARGLAHLGALEAMNDKGIVPAQLVGSSIGALLGAIYATTGDIHAAITKVFDYFHCDCYAKIKFDFLKQTEESGLNDGLLDGLSRYLRKKFFYNVVLANQLSFVGRDDYLENIAWLIDDIDIKDTKIPLAVVCTDLRSGWEVVLTEGSLRQAVAASAAIPGIFPPIRHGGQLLVDGGWVDQLPVQVCRELGVKFVVAVNVARELEQDYSSETGLDILRRTNAITRNILNQMQAKEADVLIEPEVGEISWAGFGCVEECVARGRLAAEAVLPGLLKKLHRS